MELTEQEKKQIANWLEIDSCKEDRCPFYMAHLHFLEEIIVKLLCRDCHSYGDCHRHAKQSGTDEVDYCFDGIPKVKSKQQAADAYLILQEEYLDWFDGSGKCVLCAGWPETHKKRYESGICNKNCRFTPAEVAGNKK
jgi:hypothetical protein